MKLSRISRIVQILTSLQAGHDYTAEDLAQLAGVSRRTVFRDLKELAAIGVPYSFDSKSGGYTIDPTFFLPPIDLSLQEALSLLLLVHKGRTHLPVPFKNSVLLAGLKIENVLPQQIRKYCSATLENISIQPDPYAPMDSLDRIFSLLQDAIRRKRKINIEYGSLFEGKVISTTVHPYHLMYNNRAWYVVGLSSMHGSIRTFKLNRIKNLDVLNQCFAKDRRFDVQEYLDGAWSLIPEGRIHNVRLNFSAKVARNVAEVQWHSTQKNTYNPNGSLTAEFRINGLGEISWWILGYGDQVEVLAPAELRKRIHNCARRMAEINLIR